MKIKNKEHILLLESAYDMCDDKSIEYTIAFMTDVLISQSSTPIDEYAAHDKVMEYLYSISNEEE
jgi:hypothetical protein